MKEVIYSLSSERQEELLASGGFEVRSWHSETVLHVYPRSFNEVRPDNQEHQGIGSIAGITERMQDIKNLGASAIWIGPIYESPGRDAGYDVTDYRQVDPKLGTLEDVKAMINEAHEHDIRVLFDLVPNHTSNESEWFKASEDPDHPDHAKYKDFYIWHEPKIGTELPEHIIGGDRLEGLPAGYTVPNNWSSIFSLPNIDLVKAGNPVPATTAWVWSQKRQMFYLAEFRKEQPSLSHANPEVREAMKDVIRFWFELGVDGFRIDVVNHIGKDPGFADEALADEGQGIGQYNNGVTNPHDRWVQKKLVSNWPTLGEYLEDLSSVLDEFSGRRFIYEDWMSALDHDTRVDELNPGRGTVFNFETLLNTNQDGWTADNFRRLIKDYYSRLNSLDGAAPNQVTGNHDFAALRTRLGSVEAARATLVMLSALPGNLYLWQGDAMLRPEALFNQSAAGSKDLVKTPDAKVGRRDGVRVPLAWDGSKNGGFSNAERDEIWTSPFDKEYYQTDNFAIQAMQAHSPLRLTQRVLARRQSDPALIAGGLRLLEVDDTSRSAVLGFARPDPNDVRRQLIVATNFSGVPQEVNLPDAGQSEGRIILSSSDLETEGQLAAMNGLVVPPLTTLIIDSQR